MPDRSWLQQSHALPGAPGVSMVTVSSRDWRSAAEDLAAASARLLTLWVRRQRDAVPEVRAAFWASRGILVLRLPLTAERYPRIDDLFFPAARLQRAAADLTGIRADGGDERPWLRHAAWRSEEPPLGWPAAGDAPLEGNPGATLPIDDYPFVRVDGDGVHEIAVGPIHAGIIEPGHFRFSVVGEKVLRLEQRLGYVHKGIERRFESLPLTEGHRLAARVSGDSAAAFSWAWCQALEGLGNCAVPPRALYLRALALELERIANHLGDLGALGNDAGFAFGLSQMMRLKERVLRATATSLGQRYLLDFIVPGGTAQDLTPAGAAGLRDTLHAIREDVLELRRIFDEHSGVRDRFFGTGIVTPALARRLGLAGLAGRASGQAFDLRVDLPCAPYDALKPGKYVEISGDVAARVAVRFDELLESMRLLSCILDTLPDGSHRGEPGSASTESLAIGLVEGWRGPVLVALEAAENGRAGRCHLHDPSALNWQALEHAVIGNIVPDFPLINKSFNLSYSGHDL